MENEEKFEELLSEVRELNKNTRRSSLLNFKLTLILFAVAFIQGLIALLNLFIFAEQARGIWFGYFILILVFVFVAYIMWDFRNIDKEFPEDKNKKQL